MSDFFPRRRAFFVFSAAEQNRGGRAGQGGADAHGHFDAQWCLVDDHVGQKCQGQ